MTHIQMLQWPSASVAVLGSGTAFPTCLSPSGESVSAVETEGMVRLLYPQMDEDRRAFMLGQLAATLGVRSRAWARWPGTAAQSSESDSALLAIEACRNAMRCAGLSPSDVGGIVVATSTPPAWTSATAAQVAGELQLTCPFLDVRSGCAGGLYALVLACVLAQSGRRPVIAVGADTFSKVLPANERLAALSFGDGAGALVLHAANRGGLRAASFGGNGALHHLATVPGRMPPTSLDPSVWSLHGQPEQFSAVIKEALTHALLAARAASEQAPALHLVHAAQTALCQAVSQAGDPLVPCWTSTLENHGNLGAASVLVALHELRQAGALTSGSLLAIASAGGGPSWGGAVWEEP